MDLNAAGKRVNKEQSEDESRGYEGILEGRLRWTGAGLVEKYQT